MKPRLPLLLYIFLLSVIGALSCEKDNDVPYQSTNKSPIAHAGPDRTLALPKDSVVLDGTASSDPDGTIEKYLWTKISGPASFNLVSPTSSRTGVQSLVQGVYQFELQVTDNRGASAKDTVQVTVTVGNGTNQPPVAHAGVDQVITLPTNSCTLNGNASFDPDGSIATYLWTKVAGPASYTIENPAAGITTVRDLVQGIYQFRLEVTDNGGLIARDNVQVTVNPSGVATCDISDRPHVNALLTEIGTLSEARSPYVAAAGDKIVFAGGFYTYTPYFSAPSIVDIYDIRTGTWDTAHLSQGRANMAAVSCGTKVFFAGGNIGGELFDIVDIYDASTDKWTIEHLSEPRTELAAAAVGNKVLFAGGLSDGLWDQSNRVDIYDIDTKTWSKSTLTNGKYGLSAVTVGSKVYFAGGLNWFSTTPNYNDIDIYNNVNQSWSRASFAEISGGVSGVAVGDYIFWGGIGKQNIGKVEIWGAGNGSPIINCLSYPRLFPTAVVKNDDVVFFTPGIWYTNDVLDNRFDIYNIKTGKWSVGLLNQSMASAAIISVKNTIYVAGGLIGNRTYSNKVYKLNW